MADGALAHPILVFVDNMVNEARAAIAVIVAADAPRAVARAAAEQDVATASLRSAAPLFSAAAQADGDTEWVWLLDGSALPRTDALRRLLETADAIGELPAPALLASNVLGPDGAVDAGQAPWYRRGGETDLAMRAACRALLPLRAARAGSVLVRRDAAVATGAGRPGLSGPGAALEWTARLLRDRMGYLVPGSVADALAASDWTAQAV